jgi:hypothetical protein
LRRANGPGSLGKRWEEIAQRTPFQFGVGNASPEMQCARFFIDVPPSELGDLSQCDDIARSRTMQIDLHHDVRPTL